MPNIGFQNEIDARRYDVDPLEAGRLPAEGHLFLGAVDEPYEYIGVGGPRPQIRGTKAVDHFYAGECPFDLLEVIVGEPGDSESNKAIRLIFICPFSSSSFVQSCNNPQSRPAIRSIARAAVSRSVGPAIPPHVASDASRVTSTV